jgi:hypothetical protein
MSREHGGEHRGGDHRGFEGEHRGFEGDHRGGDHRGFYVEPYAFRWYSPGSWFRGWSWIGWIVAFFIFVAIIGAISGSGSTTPAIEKKMVQAVISKDKKKKN